MSKLDNLISSLPDYAKDAKINLKSMLDVNRSELSENQTLGVALACVVSIKNKQLIEAIEEKAAEYLSPEEITAAKSAASLMGMTNVYYRTTHLISNQVYLAMQTGLRMQGLVNHGIDPIDFELYSFAVSAIGGCAMCIDSHEKKLVQGGLKPEAIQYAIKIASVLRSVSVSL